MHHRLCVLVQYDCRVFVAIRFMDDTAIAFFLTDPSCRFILLAFTFQSLPVLRQVMRKNITPVRVFQCQKIIAQLTELFPNVDARTTTAYRVGFTTIAKGEERVHDAHIKGIFVNLRGGKLLVTVIAVFHTEKLVGGIAVDNRIFQYGFLCFSGNFCTGITFTYNVPFLYVLSHGLKIY